MKKPLIILFFAVFAMVGFKPAPSNDIEFSCLKTHKASNTCHFNFKVDGAPYRYTDMGCKYSKKRDEVIRKAKEGEIALAKNWKIQCPDNSGEAKAKKDEVKGR